MNQPNLNPLLTAVEDRPIPLRKRNDLEIQESMFQDEKSWIVKDPIGLRYHRLRKAEITVLEMLDGTNTLRDVKERLQSIFPTKLVRLGDLQGLLASLHRAGMVMADTAGQAGQLLTRKRETNRRQWMGRLSNVLAIRLPGFDPEWILQRLDPWFGWIFSRAAFVVWLILALSALALLGANWTEFQLRMPQFYAFFGPRNFFWLALVMILTKICHEFGHGLSCKRFGGECHEIGVLLLVFTPAMYCDTSDSWLLPNKWHRAAIGAAGMYVEVFIASIATFLWWYSRPGLFHYLCLNVMFVSSVSTVIFNANPLLRYDGYYILSDIMEIPNLAQKSRLALLNFLRVHCLGMKPVSPRQLPERNHFFFALYSVASFAYRWMVLFVIVYFLVQIFEPYDLEVIGYSLVAVSFFGLVVMPLWQLGKFFAVPGRLQEVNKKRFLISIAVATVAGTLLMCLPLPCRVMTDFVIRPDGAQHLYVSVPGTLSAIHAQPGDRISEGQVVAELENHEIQLQIARLEGERIRYKTQLATLQSRRTFDSAAAENVAFATEALADVEKRLAQAKADADRLRLKADRDGTLMPATEHPEPVAEDETVLASWSGTPFERRNQGALMETGTLFCMVGDPGAMKATMLVPESDIKLIDSGQRIQLLLDEVPWQRLSSAVRTIAEVDLDMPPRELTMAAGGPMATQQDPSGVERTQAVMYAVDAPIDVNEFDEPILPGYRGRAKISVEPQSLGRRLLRLIRNTLYFR